jgi:lipoprotein NlpI
VSEGKIKQAIANVEQATLVRPNDPIVFFQLGLLRYQNSDFAGAVSAFGSAIILNPQYDNARYFLGLSLDKTKRKAEATSQFEILSIRYPNDQQVAFILKNLRNNFPAFYGSEDPIDPNPEDGNELPINEDEAGE